MSTFVIGILVFFLAVLIPVGIYFTIAYFSQFPSMATRKLAKKAKRLGKEMPSGFDILTEKIASKFSGKIHFDKLTRQELSIALDSVNSLDTPELHAARSIVFGAFFLVISIPFFFISKIMGLAICFAGIVIAVLKYHRPIRQLKKIRAEMEWEVSKFATTIAEGLKTDNNVLRLLMNYRAVAGETFGKELDKTIADMKSSNYENALLRFDYRINSPYLSDVIKGLLGALRGDDQSTYFNILCINLKAHERAMLMATARKRPAKINRASLCMLLTLIILYIVVLGTVIMDSLAIFNF